MSDPAPPLRLPARPSLEQLRKQAKELLRRLRDGDSAATERLRAYKHTSPTRRYRCAIRHRSRVRFRELAEARAARRRHATTRPTAGARASGRRVVAAYTNGDFTAIARSTGAVARRSLGRDIARCTPSPTWFASESRDSALALGDARLMLARQFDAESWSDLVASIAQPVNDAHASVPDASLPPFYRISARENAIMVRRSLSEKEWDVVFDVMKERGITGISFDRSLMLRYDVSPRWSCHEREPGFDIVQRRRIAAAGRMTQLRDLTWASADPITDRGLVCYVISRAAQVPDVLGIPMSQMPYGNLAFCDHLETSTCYAHRPATVPSMRSPGSRNCAASKPTSRQRCGIPLLHASLFQDVAGGAMDYGLMAFESARPTS